MRQIWPPNWFGWRVAYSAREVNRSQELEPKINKQSISHQSPWKLNEVGTKLSNVVGVIKIWELFEHFWFRPVVHTLLSSLPSLLNTWVWCYWFSIERLWIVLLGKFFCIEELWLCNALSIQRHACVFESINKRLRLHAKKHSSQQVGFSFQCTLLHQLSSRPQSLWMTKYRLRFWYVRNLLTL